MVGDENGGGVSREVASRLLSCSATLSLSVKAYDDSIMPKIRRLMGNLVTFSLITTNPTD